LSSISRNFAAFVKDTADEGENPPESPNTGEGRRKNSDEFSHAAISAPRYSADFFPVQKRDAKKLPRVSPCRNFGPEILR